MSHTVPVFSAQPCEKYLSDKTMDNFRRPFYTACNFRTILSHDLNHAVGLNGMCILAAISFATVSPRYRAMARLNWLLL